MPARSDPVRAGRHAGRGPSQRQLRVGEAIRHELALLLQRGGAHGARLDGVSLTVSEVRVSADLRHATAFVAELGRPLGPATRAALAAAAPELQGRIARALHLKYAPQLRFAEDDSFEAADRIERLIAEARRERHGPAEDDDRGPA